MKLDDNPYIRREHAELLNYYVPSDRDKAEIIAAARNMLADDDRLLAASAVSAMRQVSAHLMGDTQAAMDSAATAEAVIHSALDMRARGEPKIPPRS